ncbi:heparan-alpha-glucosaminide N-acetyltransferase [Rhizobium sp. LjRoot254]|uniref:heparan-alpha-glucosaminide N-acetyltransferase n=1 Tax=Rhizobium sp. LjRoot254 TaxID=3342297 RepID=UPI003ECF493D
MTETASPEKALTGRRIAWLDILRGAALIAMASYHFLWDLSDFGYLEPGYPETGLPKIYARSIASTFLFLSGFSLVLANRKGIQWRPFWTRFLMIVAGAGLVTLYFYLFDPVGLVFFGILHAIAAASLVGLLFLRLPAPVTAVAGVLAAVAPHYLTSEAFDTPWLWWLGLSTRTRNSFDFVPLLPWLCPFFLGIAAARIEPVISWLRQNASVEPAKKTLRAGLAFLGRHSLVFYLVHQPVLIAILYGVSLAYPAPVVEPTVRYMRNCERSCRDDPRAGFCDRFCGCTLDELVRQDLLLQLQSGAISPGKDERLNRIANECTAWSE